MSKTTVTWIFLGGLVATVAGTMFAIVVVLAAITGGVVEITGTEIVGVDGATLVWAIVGLVVATVAIVGGSLAMLASWIGALINTLQLDDKAWFFLLLVLGVFSFGILAMIAYIVAGPDSTRPTPEQARALPA